MNQFMIGLVLVIIIIILVALLGALNKMYPENFFGTCQDSSFGSCPESVKGKSCNPTGWACYEPRCVKWSPHSYDSYGNIIPGDCLNKEVTGCADCGWNPRCKCVDS